jgi:hypothetical protein
MCSELFASDADEAIDADQLYAWVSDQQRFIHVARDFSEDPRLTEQRRTAFGRMASTPGGTIRQCVPLVSDEINWACVHIATEHGMNTALLGEKDNICSGGILQAWKRICKPLKHAISNECFQQRTMCFVFNTLAAGNTSDAMGHWVAIHLTFAVNPNFVLGTDCHT